MSIRLLLASIVVLGCGTGAPPSDPTRHAESPAAARPPAPSPGADDPDPSLRSDAIAFGTMPAGWGVALSPSGDALSLLRMGAGDVPIADVVTLAEESVTTIGGDQAAGFELRWCGWASESRLLCGYRDVVPLATESLRNPGLRTPNRIPQSFYYVTRLVGVDRDGGNPIPLPRRKIRKGLGQYQDRIIDWLYRDPTSVLMVVPEYAGSSVARLDISNGRLREVVRDHDHALVWISDGRGRLRVRQLMDVAGWTWQFRPDGGKTWQVLQRGRFDDDARSFSPQGFGGHRDRLYVVDRTEGRLVLQVIDLAGDLQPRTVFAHPDVDLLGSVRIGKTIRIVGVSYVTDTLHVDYFDPSIERVRASVTALLPAQRILVVGESWDRRIHLIHASSESDPGSYYRFDSATNQLKRLFSTRPSLDGARLAAARTVRFPGVDDREVPAYLTLPVEARGAPLPAVILPRGGSQTRDEWGFDWVVQFLAARGYAVLETTFLGSQGFSEDWTGDGGFAAWERVVSDIEQGARWLVDEGIVDPDRLCILGWGHGGYAAMMSAIAHPTRYRCAASVAGVADPRRFIDEKDIYLNARSFDEFVGNEPDVLTAGSPIERIDELSTPLLIAHGRKDVDVSVRQSRSMVRNLERRQMPVEWIEFDDAEHVFWTSRDRISLLEHLGGFLDRSIGKPAPSAAMGRDHDQPRPGRAEHDPDRMEATSTE